MLNPWICQAAGAGKTQGEERRGKGQGFSTAHQDVVLRHGDVVGVHGEADALLHLGGESARLAGALAPLLPRAPGETAAHRDGVSTHSQAGRVGTTLGLWEQ